MSYEIDNIKRKDEDADLVILTMIEGCAAAAVAPVAVDWAIAAGALGAGVVGIGCCYGVKITKEEAWKLIKQFIKGAGLAWSGFAFGSKIFTVIMKFTGFGYLGGMALDAVMSSAIAYAVGGCAKSYFKGDHDTKNLGKQFRDMFNEKNR
jgi:uncharacterized protein (DUF697 family)